MKVSKKTETEVLNVYDTWLHSYLNGDVTTYDSYFDDAFHFIGSTANEEFLNRTDTTQFFADTAAQLAGKCDLRNESRTIEKFGDLVFITHVFDAWFLNGSDYSYYGRFRFSNTLRKNKEGWRFIYQHFSTPDSKTESGETIGFDKVNEENQQLREAIQRRTTELELMNRELQIEGAVDRIRAEAVAMKSSSDLLDIVVTMRNEFIKLGHEAHYFWHMMWLPKTYEKAMTSGDGSKIGFVMELPRHIHGNIPTLAKWEKSNQPMVVYPMDVDAAIDYVDKMIDLGDFKHIDPQAPTHDDIRHIGGLTFVMARTTHGEIGYSLPGVVTKPPKEDIAILVKFAGAFDLAHQRFLDLQKAERQAKETLIELSLERIRSQVTAMQASTDLFNIVVAMRNEFISLGHQADYFWHMQWLEDSYEMSMTSEDGSRVGMVINIPKFVHDKMEDLAAWEQGDDPTFVLALDAAEAWQYIDNMNTYGQYKQADPNAPSEEDIQHIGGLTFIIARTSHGEIGYSLPGVIENPPKAALDILKRFAGAFDLAYRRFLDLQKAEAQARETQIELALEKVRSRTMAMQQSDEIGEVALILFEQLESLGGELWGTGFAFCTENSDTDEFWFVNKDGIMPYLKIPNTTDTAHQQMYQGWQDGLELFSIEKGGKDLQAHYEYMLTVPSVQPIFQKILDSGIEFPTWQKWHAAYFSQGYLLVITTAPYKYEDIFKRFAKVFEQAYTRFLDLQKAEAQAREAQIETALEKVRSRTMAMQHSDELQEASHLLDQQVRQLGIKTWGCAFNIYNENDSSEWFGNEAGILPTYTVPRVGIFKEYYDKGQNGATLFIKEITGDEIQSHYEFMSTLPVVGDVLKELKRTNGSFPTYQIDHVAYFKYGYLLFITRETVPDAHDIFKRFAKVFEQTYTRFLDLQKAEDQAREAQIEAALERTRTQSMLMQHSDELDATSKVFHEQLQMLGINTEFSYVWLPDEEKGEHQFWVAWNSEKKGSHEIKSKAIVYPLDKSEPYTASCFKDWASGISVHTHHIEPAEVKTFFTAWEELLKDAKNLNPNYFSNGLYYAEAFMKYGCFGINIKHQISDEEKQILERFSVEFERTYTRFLDLQKAEAQAQEAQIEAALERVRSRSLAMHKTDELQEVVQVVAEELKNTGVILDTGGAVICTYFEDSKDVIHWTATEDASHPSVPYKLPYFEDELFDEAWMSKDRGDDYFAKEFSFEVKNAFFSHAFEHSDYRQLPEEYKKVILESESHGIAWAWSKNSAIMIPNIQGNLPSEEEKDILKRFAKVFEQAFIRFMDLQKAETQARTAQINLAVERVRAKALAMHKSGEIMEVVAKLKEEVMALEIPNVIAATIFLKEGEDKVRMWDLSTLEKDNEGYQIPFDITFKLKKKDPNLYIKRVWENPENYFLEKQEAKDFERILVWLHENDKSQVSKEVEEFIETTNLKCLHHAVKKLNNGKLVIDVLDPPTAEMETILSKMGAAFDLAYKRFEDLQRAEKQTREAQVEMALEKVRSRTMAMQHSDELPEAANVLFTEVQNLGIPAWSCGYNILSEDKKSSICIMSSEGEIQSPFVLPLTEHESLKPWHNAILNNEDFFVYEQGGTDLVAHYDYMQSLPDLKATFQQLKEADIPLPTFQVNHLAKFTNGFLLFITYERVPEAHDIFKRFGKVFEQTYTRFLDLKRAEEQAREAKIEAALERVRSQSMGMQSSADLSKVTTEMFNQLRQFGGDLFATGIVFCDKHPGHVEQWHSIPKAGMMSPFIVPIDLDYIHQYRYDEWKKGTELFSIEIPSDFIEQHFLDIFNLPSAQKVLKDLEHNNTPMTEAPPWEIDYGASFKHGYILVSSLKHFEEAAILPRFANVFEQVYTRYLDLQKAEAQARESQIQLSLERVRARAMAMHDSEELDEVLTVLCEQFDVLGIIPMSTHMTVLDLENNTFTFRETGKFGNRSFGEQTVALDAMDNWEETIENWKADKATAINKLHFPKEQLPEVWEVFHESFASMPKESRITPDDYPDGIYHTAGKHPFGYIGMNQTQPATEEEEQIVIKFAKEFGSAYQRFLDLQKAEEQAREAQIEASLEKVRSVALTLQKSEDMLAIAQALYEQLLALGFNDIRNAIIDIHNDETETFLDYDYSHDMSSAITEFSYYGDPVIEQQIKKTQSANDAFFEIELKGEQLKELIETRIRNGEQDDPRLHEVDHLTYNLYSFGNGAIGISNFGVLSDEQKTVLKRFRNVFTFAYKRYTDLANAEAQAREAKIEASLEKVRSVALSMVESTDLLHIVKALYEQLVELGFSDIRNALIDVNNEDDKTFLDYDYSEEMGGTVTLMSYDDDPTLEEQLRVIASTTDGYSEMVLEGQQLKDLIEMRRKNGEADDPRLLKTDSVAYILYAFGNGAVGISNFGILSQDQKSILDRFRNVFTFAYQRFQDLQVREEQSAKLLDEKIRLEKTLSDLQAAQKQLIQSEKMASLGELTAGIAHEIQNPLNFVNNFSEVSNELIEEIDEELAKGDMEEVKALLQDIKQNLEKINHHGKRADGIVKGMLQHSRSSGVTKEPTELNILCDEYLRLSYHGLRAKDKSFNATLETNFDDSVGKVPIIPQDIGRVILNLLTNAFYAVTEKKKQAIDGYQPTVGLETRNKKNSVQVVVTDNGNGIPQQVVDKIFQPFFTTKPTGQGTGLGLSMSYDIITKAHNGTLEVATKETKGTTFTITLPKT